MNNFGTYMAERVAGQMGVGGYDNAVNYHNLSLDDVDGVSDRTWSALKVLRQEVAPQIEMLNSPIANIFLDAFLYCYADCVTNFSADIELIKEINPNAKIIVVGVYNTLTGTKIEMDGQTVDLGELVGKGYDLVNAYIKAFDKNSPNYYYAEPDKVVDTFMTQIANSESFEALMDDPDGKSLMDDLWNSGRDSSFVGRFISEEQLDAMIEPAVEQQFNAATPNPDGSELEQARALFTYYLAEPLTQAELKDTSSEYATWQDLNTALDLPEEYVSAEQKAVIIGAMTQIRGAAKDLVKNSVQHLLYEAAKVETLNMNDLMIGMQDMDSVTGEVAAYITSGVQPSSATMQLLQIADRFMLYMGVGQHPSATGCDQMYQSVLAAYEKANNGGYTAFEEVFSKYYPYLIGAALKIKEAYDNGDFDKMMKLMSKMDEISEMLEVIDESGLTADQLRELVQMKGELEARVGEILDYLGLTMDDVKAMLDENSSPEQIAEYINKFQQIKAVLDVIDEEGLTADQLKEALQLKKDLEKRMNETLDALGITMDELLAALDENATPEKIQEYLEKYEQISAVLAIIDEEGLTAEQLKEFFQIKKDVEARLNAALDILGIDMEELIKLLDENTTPEKIAEYAEQIQAAMEILQNLPTMDQVTEQLKAEIWKQIEQAQQMIEQRAAEISEELAAQIRELSEMLKNAYEQGDYQEIIDQLMPIGEQLLAIGEAVYGLPEYEAAMNEYMETSNAAMAGLEDRVAALEQQMGKLTAKCIDVETAAKITFPSGSVSATLSWPVDEDAAGYILKKDGKEVNFAENEAGMIFEDPDVQIGETYKYEITPYIYWGDNIYGKTFTTTVVPKVKLAKAKIKSVKAAKKAFTAKWKAVKNADGYQISYKVGKKTKKATVKGAKKLSKKVKKLQSKKKYTVKVRAYKKVDGTKYYGGWSRAKKVKIK